MPFACFFPQAEASLERIAVVAKPALGRQLFQFLGVAASQNDFVGLESSHQPGNHVPDMTAPLLLSVLQQGRIAHVALVCPLLVWKMTQFHGLYNAIHDESRTESGA